MALDESYKPAKKGLVGRIDQGLMELNRKLTEEWQNKTHKDKSELESILYSTSFLGFGARLSIDDDPLTMGITLYAGAHAVITKLRPKEKRRVYKHFNVIAYSVGIVDIAYGAGLLAYGIAMGDRTLYLPAMYHLSFGIGAWGLSSGNYVSLAEIRDVQKKEDKKFMK